MKQILAITLLMIGCTTPAAPVNIPAYDMDLARAAIFVARVQIDADAQTRPDDTASDECATCYGTGKSGDGITVCPNCNGTGKRTRPIRHTAPGCTNLPARGGDISTLPDKELATGDPDGAEKTVASASPAGSCCEEKFEELKQSIREEVAADLKQTKHKPILEFRSGQNCEPCKLFKRDLSKNETLGKFVESNFILEETTAIEGEPRPSFVVGEAKHLGYQGAEELLKWLKSQTPQPREKK